MQVSTSLHYSQGYIYGSSVIPIEGTHNSNNYSSSCKCELMKLSLPLVSSMYADAAFTVAAPKYWNSLPDELRTMS